MFQTCFLDLPNAHTFALDGIGVTAEHQRIYIETRYFCRNIYCLIIRLW